MKKGIIYLFAAFLLAAPIASGENPEHIALFAEPKNPTAIRAIEMMRSTESAWTADGQYATRLLSTKLQPVKLEELCDYNQVRSIQVSEFGLSVYDYFPCTFYYEGQQLCFRKTGGSQRKAGLLSQTSDTEISFDGWWFIGGDKEVNDESHKNTGTVYKLSPNKVIMVMDGDKDAEILEFTKPGAPTGLTFEDKKGYVYSFVYDADDTEELAVEAGGRYDGNIVIPDSFTVDDVLLYVSVIRKGAMWKKDGADNIGTITSVTLPSCVWLVGSDAFRGNHQLKKVSYGTMTRIENRAFFDCPSLKLNPTSPKLAFTDPGELSENLQYVVMPSDENDAKLEHFTWAFFKERHTGIGFQRWKSQNNPDAMACWCENINFVKGAEYKFRNTSLVGDLLKGYMHRAGHVMMLADNDYVGSHDFPVFSRWLFGEKETAMPAAFADAQAAKYGQAVKTCYEVGKVSSTKEQLAFTEFKLKDITARIALSWVKDGKEVCSYTKTTEADEEGSVWNVDDEGTYGIPHILTIAYDDKGNVELFLLHEAPESWNFMQFKQNGDKLELVQEYSIYCYVDPILGNIPCTKENLMKAWTEWNTEPNEYALYDVDGDGINEVFLRNTVTKWESALSVRDGVAEELAGFDSSENHWLEFAPGYLYHVAIGDEQKEVTAIKVSGSKPVEEFLRMEAFDGKDTISAFTFGQDGVPKEAKYSTIKKNFAEDPQSEFDILCDSWNPIVPWIFQQQ